jgi:hypothetical protein
MTDYEIVTTYMRSTSEEKQEILKTQLSTMSPLGQLALMQESVIFELREEIERLMKLHKAITQHL